MMACEKGIILVRVRDGKSKLEIIEDDPEFNSKYAADVVECGANRYVLLCAQSGLGTGKMKFYFLNREGPRSTKKISEFISNTD
jgi:hypothetical protein